MLSCWRAHVATCILVSAVLLSLLSFRVRCAATKRVSAVRLLHVTLVYGKDEVLPLLPTVVLALQSAVADEDAGLLGRQTRTL